MSTRQSNIPQAVIRPDIKAWPMLIAGSMERVSDEHRRFRSQLGLPPDHSMVMSGHQAEFWHPGILAKYFAMNAAAEVTGTAAAWLTVDQDSGEPWRLRYPARQTVEGALRLVARQGSIPGTPPPPDVPTGCMPAFHLQFSDKGTTEPFVTEGLSAIESAAESHRNAPSAASQVAAALDKLISPLAPIVQNFFALSLSRTDAFNSLVDRMSRDPRGCVLAYNTAVDQFPIASLRKLAFDDETQRFEMPLWRVEFGEPRRHVFSNDLPSIPREQLAPKALLMTGLVRWLGCELFIHGLGGGKYELVTDDWFHRWLPEAHLAPAVVASATLTLPLGAGIPAEREIARAAWESHRALHDPAFVGDTAAATEKSRRVEQVRKLREAGADAAPEYRAMHESLAHYRDGHAVELKQVSDRAAQLAARRAEARVATDRTWPFPLYPRQTLSDLNDQIHGAFAR